MSVENKRGNLTTKSITRSQAKNNPKLVEIIEENRKKALEIKNKASAENQGPENKNKASNNYRIHQNFQAALDSDIRDCFYED